MVLVLGPDSLRADRALQRVLEDRGVNPQDVTRIWGDESSFGEVFSAATARSLFSSRTVVIVRRAERLRGGGGIDPGATEDESGSPEAETAEAGEEERNPQGRRAARGEASTELPVLDPSSCIILVARKVDRRVGLWNKIGKVAEIVDAEYLKNKALYAAAADEARALGLRLSEEIVRETVEQSGPSLGRIVSEFEKMRLFQGGSGGASEDLLAVTSSRPLYLLSDSVCNKDKRESLDLLGEALRQGEAGLRILATAHGTIRKLALFRALRKRGVSASDAGAQAGLMPFKVGDAERASRNWTDSDLSCAFALLAEADRRLKLSAPQGPVLAHTIVAAAGGGRV